jgi:hypothetical protein
VIVAIYFHFTPCQTSVKPSDWTNFSEDFGSEEADISLPELLLEDFYFEIKQILRISKRS